MNGAGGAYVVIAVCFGIGGGIIGRSKGQSFWLWFLVSGAVPIFGVLAAIFMRDDRAVERMRCPGCGKVHRVHDAFCLRCGTELYLPQDDAEVIAPERARQR
ncbi:unannotated protein [freshwater metagenome]|uniref:Unannotated protein n=1 Tax=freshwater metagenome TaxID=449393 RepID=A0A6J7EPS7_9ZZZZ|nr:hypothetical protein [Actinomycetota bacterium]